MERKKEIVATFRDYRGNTLSLFKTKGKWSIYQEVDGRITISCMPRMAAKKEWRKKVKLRKPL